VLDSKDSTHAVVPPLTAGSKIEGKAYDLIL